MAKVIIFGLLDTAELAHYYLENDSEHDVVAFTVHKAYINTDKFKGLPVVPFEELERYYPANLFTLFAPLTAKNMNRLREDVYLTGKRKGYNFISYVSSQATAFNTKIGENCFILENNTIQPFTSIGNNVVLWSGNHIGHHSKVGDHCFFTSHVVLSGNCVVESHCFFGVNSTVRDFCNISQGTLLGMASSLNNDVNEPWGIYVGSPAKRKGSRLSYEVY